MKNIILSDSGNIFIVLLTLAWVAYSLYRKFQKTRPSNYPEQGNESEEVPMKKIRNWMDEVILGEEFVEKEPVVVAEPRSFQDEIAEYKRKKSKEPKPFLEEELRLYKGGEYAETKVSPLEEDISGIVEDISDEHAASLDFDLRRAILYSAILKRPFS